MTDRTHSGEQVAGEDSVSTVLPDVAAVSASNSQLVNCTFSANETDAGTGGGLHIDFSTVRVTNSVFRGNESPSGETDLDQIAMPQVGNLGLFHNSIEGWTGPDAWDLGPDGGVFADVANSDCDPRFAEALGCDGVAGTLDDNPRVTALSACVDAGDAAAVLSPVDYDGSPRIAGASVDLGATEVPDGTPVHYVDAAATGDGSGTRWADAFADLQSALATAAPGEAIYVAAGTYTPAPGAESVSFELPSGVALHGGFAGCERLLSEADPNTHLTLLSGDLAGDDPVDLSDNSDRVVSVGPGATSVALTGVTISGGNGLNGAGLHVAGAAAASNLTIAGNAAVSNGAGLYVAGGSTFSCTGCILSDNTAGFRGGGAYVAGGAPVFDQCKFLVNTADEGAGLYAADSAGLVVTASEVTSNTATGWGGGMHLAGGGSWLHDVSFEDNNASNGGGACLQGGGHVVEVCTFAENNAAGAGGGVKSVGGVTFERCIFSDNSTLGTGGGLAAFGASEVHADSCLFTINKAANGGGAWLNGNADLVNCTLRGNEATGLGGGVHADGWSPWIANSILYENTAVGAGDLESAQIETGATGTPAVDYTCVEGWTGLLGGTANLGDDPKFQHLSPIGAVSDAEINSESICVDAAQSTFSTVSLDVDGGPRIVGPAIDMGAWEFE